MNRLMIEHIRLASTEAVQPVPLRSGGGGVNVANRGTAPMAATGEADRRRPRESRTR